MFDIAPTELLLVAIVALLVIGPKDLPKAMRFVGHWVGRARGVARQFRSGFDAMVREAELAEMEKKWAEENARIMRENPLDDTPSTESTPPEAPALPAPEETPPKPDDARGVSDGTDDWGNPISNPPPPAVAAAQNELPLGVAGGTETTPGKAS